jgi:hypothetical protein
MSSKSKQTSSIDPQSSALIYGNADRANSLANSFKPYTGQLTAGFNDDQNSAQGLLKDFAYQDVGAEPLNQSIFTAQNAAGYQPLNIATPDQIKAQQIQAGQLSNTDLNPYMNPFQSQVIDQTLNQYDRQNQIDLNNARGRAASAGAFGGSGSALLQSQTQEANSRNLGGVLAGLNSQNFSQAQNAASSDLGRRFAADQSNQGADLNAQQLNQAGYLSAQQANQGAGLQGNAQRLQAAGVLSGLSDQQRAQRLQNLGVLSAVGDTQQQQQQSELDAQHNAYLEWLNTQLQGQNVANSGLNGDSRALELPPAPKRSRRGLPASCKAWARQLRGWPCSRTRP